MRKISCLFISLFISLSAIAHDFEYNGLCYNITSETDKTVCTTVRSDAGASYSGDIVIPAQVTNEGTTYTVTSIGENSFKMCSNLTSIIIPNTVNRIEELAFYDCTRLEAITVSNSIQYIGYDAFYYCRSLPIIDNCRYADNILLEVIDKNATSITIKPGTKYIYSSAFAGCVNLTSVEMPSILSLIENNAFEGCQNLQSITLSYELEKINDAAFKDCKSLTSIYIPRNVSEICGDVFSNCTSLNSIIVDPGNMVYDSRHNCNAIIETLSGKLIAGCKTSAVPFGVYSINKHAFYGCEGLITIDLPMTLSDIGEDAFYGCYNLESITVDPKNHTLDSRNNCNAIIETSTGTLICGCMNTVIPDDVKIIRNNAFKGCKKLENINFPVGLTSIGDQAFKECSGLTAVDFPNTLLTIGKNAFEGCILPTSLTIPNSVTTIGSEAFKGWVALETFTVGNGLTVFPDNTLSGSPNIKKLVLDSRVIVERDYDDYLNVTKNILGENVEEIIIGNSINEIGAYAFFRFEKLKKVKLGDNIKIIRKTAFATCENFTEINFPEGLTTIESDAFMECNNLRSIWIPKTCTSIGENSFISVTTNKTTTSIVVEDGNPVYDSRDNCNAIIETATNTLIRGCVNTIIPNTVTRINVYAFMHCEDLKTIKIPDSVLMIDDLAFSDCNGLEYVEFGKNLQNLYANSFNCFSQGSIITVKMNSPAFVGKNFDQKSSIAYIFSLHPFETFIVGDDVTTIGKNALKGCESVKKLLLGKNLESIGENAFAACTGLEAIKVEAMNAPSVAATCFDGVNKSIPVYVPCQKVSEYREADGWKEFTNILAYHKYDENAVPGTPGIPNMHNDRANYECEICGYVDETKKATYEARDYMSMTALGSNMIIGFKKEGNPDNYIMQVSVDGNEWYDPMELTATKAIATIPVGKTYYFRHGTATATDHISSANDAYWSFTMEGEGSIEADGNIMSLLDHTCLSTTSGKNAFSSLFYNCTNLTKAPELTATSLGANCYYKLFNGCSSLQEVELPMVDCSAEGCLTEWLEGTAADGKLIVPLALIGNSTIEASVPYSWNLATRMKLNEDPDHKGNFYTTFYDSRYDYIVEDGFKAYSGNIEGDCLKLNVMAENIIPKGDGAVIHGGSEEVLLTVSEGSAEKVAGNVLTGSDVDITAPANSYFLTYGQYKLGFYRLAVGNPITAHKAYLIYEKSVGAPALRMVFGDGLTSIVSPREETEEESTIYSINGMRLNKTQKGINIVNGKKVVMK